MLYYATVHVVAALLLGAMAPIGRRTDGRLVLRNPFEGLDAIQPAPGLVGLVVVLGQQAFILASDRLAGDGISSVLPAI